MQLNIAINGQSLASIPLDPSRTKDEQYLKALKRLLALKNHAILSQSTGTLSYFIEVPSKMLTKELVS